MNYESAWRMEAELAAWAPDLIIADEGHKLKNPQAKASKAMHHLGLAARYKLLLTGTIITNRAVDVFSQYKFLNPAVFGNSFYSFKNRFFEQGFFPSQLTLRPSKEAEFTEKLHSIAYRVTKEQCLDLPETVDIIRLVDLEAPARKIYRDLVRDSFAALGGEDSVTVANILTRLTRLSQLTGGFLKTDENELQQISTAKLSALVDIIEEAVAEGRKLVVVARFVPEINAIRNLLEAKQIGYSCVMGGVKDRAEQVSLFQNEPGTMVFIGQIQTAALGLTLTAASDLLFYSTDYSMSNYEQARARIHRVGQKNRCTYYHLVAKGTIDEKVLRALHDKADLARTLIDDWQHGQNPYA